MSQPPQYTRTASFAGDERNNAGGRSTVRTAALDAELDALGASVNAASTNLGLIQRDDGELRDKVVSSRVLAADVLGLMAAATGTPRGIWATGTAYAVKDLATNSGNTYFCAVAHTSATFSTDLAAGKWVLFSLSDTPAASSVTFAPTATLAATDVQAALAECDTENRALSAAAQAAADAAAADAADLALDLLDYTSTSKGGGQVNADVRLNYTARTLAWHQQKRGVTPSMFLGAGTVDPTGVADSTVALQAWAASLLPKAGDAGARYKVSGTLTFAVGVPVEGCGMVIDASAGGTWTGAAVVTATGSISTMAGISGALTKGQQVINFAAAHNLSAGDSFILYNPADYSWYPAGMRPSDISLQRAEYREGEFCRVLSVTDSDTVVVEEPLWSDYTAGTLTVYRMAKAELVMRDLTVLGPVGVTVSVIRPKLCTRVRLENVHAPASYYLGLYPDRCFDAELRGCSGVAGVPASGDSYGILIGNCQRVRVFGGSYVAKRGGFDVGGDDLPGAVPSRDIKVIDAYIGNDPSGTSPACDLHANLQGFTAQNCTIRGGASWAGVDVSYIDCDTSSPAAPAGALFVGGSDWLGGKAEVRGGSMATSTASSLSAVVRTVVNRYALEDTTVMLDCGDIEAGANTILVLTEMVSTATKKVNVIVDRASFRTVPASLAQIARMQGTGSGGDGDRVVVEGIDNAPSGCNLYVATAGFGSTIKAKLMRQSAHGSVTTGIGASVASINPLTWRYPYGSKVPVAEGAGINLLEIGTKRLVAVGRVSNAAEGLVEFGTADRTNFPSATSVSGYLTVAVNEL